MPSTQRCAPHRRPMGQNAFCQQCGERVKFSDARSTETRCGDCERRPVPARFSGLTGERLDPPAPGRRSLLASYMGPVVSVGSYGPFPAVGAHHVEQPGLSTRNFQGGRGG